MKTVVFCASEASPFAKVGGLGDVVGSLPKALVSLGISPVVILPLYKFLAEDATLGLTRVGEKIPVPFLGGSEPQWVDVWKGQLQGVHGTGSSIPVYFIESKPFFSQWTSVYPSGNPQEEWEGFFLFSKAIIPVLKALEIKADILHLHDWHSAYTAVELLKARQETPDLFAACRSVLTLHNIAYQGIYENSLNLLEEGLSHVDYVTAVSPTYAHEIQTIEGGAGLESYTQSLFQQGRLKGIVNGIDYSLFSPETDAFIPEHYSPTTFTAGKSLAKRVIQQELGLPQRPDIPMFCMVSRLVEQKGLDLILPIIDWLAGRPAQWVFLGNGEPGYEVMLKEWNSRFTNVRSYIGFNISLAQKLYAGSDVFMMPSRFEPCGLGQLIAMRYGTVPLVRATGGLSDTVIDIRTDAQLGTGFCFKPYDSSAFLETVDAALSYIQDKETWHSLVRHGMAENFDWAKSAKGYQEVYLYTLELPPVSHRN